ncbi:MAG: hypothetical protein F4X59_17085 [Holophagales bacterium]|nr:hypothetical protein [Holophagales bacterium]MYC11821.1 hypothetical protein [Holophagales bacterium]
MKKRLSVAALWFAVPVAVYGQTAPTVSIFESDEALTVYWDDPGDATLHSVYDVEYVQTSSLAGMRAPRLVGLGRDLEGRSDTTKDATWLLVPSAGKGRGKHYAILRNLRNGSEYSVRVTHRRTDLVEKNLYRATAISIDNPGSGYTGTVTYTISGQGGPTHIFEAQALGGLISAITVTNPGSGYTSPPTVTLSGGGGSGAEAIARLHGEVGGITVTNRGSGYTSEPNVILSGGGGTGATAAVALSGVVSGIEIDRGGYYTNQTGIIYLTK